MSQTIIYVAWSESASFTGRAKAFQDAQEVCPASDSLKHNIEYTQALQKEAWTRQISAQKDMKDPKGVCI